MSEIRSDPEAMAKKPLERFMPETFSSWDQTALSLHAVIGAFVGDVFSFILKAVRVVTKLTRLSREKVRLLKFLSGARFADTRQHYTHPFSSGVTALFSSFNFVVTIRDMETLLVNCVEKNLSQFMLTNAIFLCERLLAEFPSEVNLQLLARCYLSNSQAYSAYYILKGSKTPQSRYLFAFSCFKLELHGEAEASLLPSEEYVEEIPGGAAGHYLLGLIYRYAGRKNSSIQQFRKALSFDPLCWEAYRELCSLGAAEEASTVFGNVAAQRLQMTCVSQRINFSEGETNTIDQRTDSDKASTKDTSLWQPEDVPEENQQNMETKQLAVDIPSGIDKAHNSASHTNGWDLNTPSPVLLQALEAPPPMLYKN
ncbi:unnamed protein product [Microthlaspi erraticum]|nr:unnamed protein product [Microthlaspi erraticum]